MQRLKQHPDLGGDHWDASLINEAYRVLTDPESRKQYDAERELIQRSSPDKPTPSTSDKNPDTDEQTPDVAAKKPDSSSSPGTASPDSDTICLFCETPQRHGALTDPDAVCPTCASPLNPASEQQFETTGQRTVNRMAKDLKITFYSHWLQPTASIGNTLDISPNGMRFVSDHRLDEGSLVRIASQSIDAVAQVKRCDHDAQAHSWIIGVAFKTLRLARSQGAFFSAEA